jgi:type II secretion system protein J
MEPRAVALLEEVDDVQFEFLDEDLAWQEQWPPLELAGAPTPPRPRAIRIRMTLADWGEIERIVELTQ